MRAVIDTNVLLSGLFWHGAPHLLLERARSGELTLVTSPALLAELADVIGRPKLAGVLSRSGTTGEHALNQIRRLVDVIEPPPLPRPLSRDPDDDEALALAIAANADLIVSGDPDLLDIKAYQGILIVSPAETIRILDRRRLHG